MEKIATRMAYGQALCNLGDKYDFIVMDADLSGSTQTGMFAKKFPERFFNCGIAEQNMLSVAAGIATTGKPVFVSSFAMFAVGRAYEQIRNSVCYPRLNVKICASHAGVTVGEDGATHQYCEDLGVLRTIPELMVISPADAVEAYACIEEVLKYDGPVYVRLGRYAVPTVFDKETYKFRFGKAVPVCEGDDAVVFATGIMLAAALEAKDILAAEGINISVVNVHTIKPIDKEVVVKYATKTGRVVTAEEHTIVGGLGSAVAEVLSENAPTKMKRVGMNDCFGTSAPAGVLLERYELNASAIVKAVKELM